jgi:cation diffusion facilitator CzcD-associated flavoprotein CzcO
MTGRCSKCSKHHPRRLPYQVSRHDPELSVAKLTQADFNYAGGHRVTGEGMTIVMESIARQLVNLDVEIQYRTKLVNVSRRPKSGQWTLSIRPMDAPDDSPVMYEDFDKLVVAVGLYSTPAVPLCIQPFAVKYRGTITSHEAPFVVHTSGLADEGVQQAIRAKRREVVVIGASKSALDAAERLALVS